MIYEGRKEVACDWFRLQDGCTVFQAEVAAIAKAAELLMPMQNEGGKFVKIFVDSQAAIMAVGNPHVTSRVVADTIDKLNALSVRAKSVTLVWIPAHKGHQGNERADDLAKLGTEKDLDAGTRGVKQPHATVKRKLHDKIHDEWQDEWSRARLANHTKSFYRGPNKSKAKFVYKLARLELGRFVRIVTGHNNLSFFQTKIGLFGNPSCRFCNAGNETVTHFINECPRFFTSQREIFAGKPPTPDMKWSVRDVLDFSYTKGINEAYEGLWTDGMSESNGMEEIDMPLYPDWMESGYEIERDEMLPLMRPIQPSERRDAAAPRLTGEVGNE